MNLFPSILTLSKTGGKYKVYGKSCLTDENSVLECEAQKNRRLKPTVFKFNSIKLPEG
jgi:hypothetical protein